MMSVTSKCREDTEVTFESWGGEDVVDGEEARPGIESVIDGVPEERGEGLMPGATYLYADVQVLGCPMHGHVEEELWYLGSSLCDMAMGCWCHSCRPTCGYMGSGREKVRRKEKEG
jgi:hypothetical protein